jgi:hypothetical protein
MLLVDEIRHALPDTLLGIRMLTLRVLLLLHMLTSTLANKGAYASTIQAGRAMCMCTGTSYALF